MSEQDTEHQMSEPETARPEARPKSIAWWQFGLIGLMFMMFVMFAAGLGRDSKILPSPLIGKPAFAFDIAKLGSDERLRLADFRGKVVVMNFWASWCLSCKDEHHVLLKVADRLKSAAGVQFIGINHKDTAANAEAFLKKMGRFPYPSGVDPQGRLGLEFGVYGMPETFFITADGVIADKHIGALTEKVLVEKIARASGYKKAKEAHETSLLNKEEER